MESDNTHDVSRDELPLRKINLENVHKYCLLSNGRQIAVMMFFKIHEAVTLLYNVKTKERKWIRMLD
jgi:hypothetical protein